MQQSVPITDQLYAWSEDMPAYSALFGLPWFTVLAVIFLGVGFVLASSFLVLEVSTDGRNRSFVKELSLAVPASISLGIGFLYFLQTAGIYV